MGVISRDEALFQARQKGLDLVEVAPDAKPPVCKIIDFKKFRYQEEKKFRAGKKGRRQDIKEIRFTPFIASNDYEMRLNRAKDFLAQGHKLRLTVKFLGRQITHKEFGYDLLKKAVSELSARAKIESEPKLQGKILMLVLTPIKQNQEQAQEQSKEQSKDAKAKN